ncbi:MAG TPA: DUF1338 domain-containing protein [Planctomycetaceae bacterium]|nr:DUF1338 domain-containing protein [Planctomycetaceae bacterium]
MAVTQFAIRGPHQKIAAADDRERFALLLFDTLWDRYRERVAHVGTYERVIAEAGATFVNDHIAFRTFACQRPLTGIASISRIFETLGYRGAGCYNFDDKHLTAIHYEHPNRDFPKLFISELRVWELGTTAQAIITRTLARHREPIATAVLARLASLSNEHLDPRSEAEVLAGVAGEFHTLPWPAPERSDVEALNRDSQYAAWVLVHGYNVNHFTSLINSHGVAALNDIEKTASALRAAGVPMKAEIEGAPGTKLRQTATEAAVIEVPAREGGVETTMPWTYAYFELAERGELVDPDTGERRRFEGFLGPQATQLFEMTRPT